MCRRFKSKFSFPVSSSLYTVQHVFHCLGWTLLWWPKDRMNYQLLKSRELQSKFQWLQALPKELSKYWLKISLQNDRRDVACLVFYLLIINLAVFRLYCILFSCKWFILITWHTLTLRNPVSLECILRWFGLIFVMSTNVLSHFFNIVYVRNIAITYITTH